MRQDHSQELCWETDLSEWLSYKRLWDIHNPALSLRLGIGPNLEQLTCSHSMWSRVYETVGHPLVSLSVPTGTAAMACGRFAAVCPACRWYRSITARCASSRCSCLSLRIHSSKCEQCRVYSNIGSRTQTCLQNEPKSVTTCSIFGLFLPPSKKSLISTWKSMGEKSPSTSKVGTGRHGVRGMDIRLAKRGKLIVGNFSVKFQCLKQQLWSPLKSSIKLEITWRGGLVKFGNNDLFKIWHCYAAQRVPHATACQYYICITSGFTLTWNTDGISLTLKTHGIFLMTWNFGNNKSIYAVFNFVNAVMHKN